MSFPIITFKFSDTPVVYQLQELVTQKFQSLEHYVAGKSDVRCEVEFKKVAPHHNGEVYRTEVNLWIDGVMYRAEATEDSFDKSIDAVRSDLDSELNRARGKRLSLLRRGARKIKSLVRGY
jgi:ribosomal subunit interface protein